MVRRRHSNRVDHHAGIGKRNDIGTGVSGSSTDPNRHNHDADANDADNGSVDDPPPKLLARWCFDEPLDAATLARGPNVANVASVFLCVCRRLALPLHPLKTYVVARGRTASVPPADTAHPRYCC